MYQSFLHWRLTREQNYLNVRCVTGTGIRAIDMANVQIALPIDQTRLKKWLLRRRVGR